MKTRWSLVLFLLIAFLSATAQDANLDQPAQGPQMGVSTGAAHAAVRDAQSRPITAGGFIDGAAVVFTDVTKQAGLDRFHHRSGSFDKTTTLAVFGKYYFYF